MTTQRGTHTLVRAGRHAEQGAPLGIRLRHHLRDPLNSKVYPLALNTVLSSGLGMGYWIVAAHLYSPRDVGVGGAIVSTTMLLGNLSRLNLNGTLVRFLPSAGIHGRRMVTFAYGLTCLVALAASLLFVLLVPAMSQRLGLLARTPPLALAFAVGVSAWSVFTLQESILTALRGALWVPVENAAFNIAKLALMVPLASVMPALGIFASWNVAVILALAPVTMLVYRRLLPRLGSWNSPAGLPRRATLARFAALDYVGFLFLQAGTTALPVLVTARLGAEKNAVFYVGWLLGVSLELVAYHFATSMTVESAADESRLAEYTKQVLRRGLVLFAPVVLLICVFAPTLLSLFGPRYAQSGSTVLRLLAVAVLPKLVVIVFVAACRVQRTVGRIIVVQAATSALVVSLALPTMGTLGVTGVGIAYLAAQLTLAAAVVRPLARVIRAAS